MTAPASLQLTLLPLPNWKRRAGVVVFLAVYCWIAAIFPVIHAVAERPALATILPGEAPPSSPLPLGHDHFTCHFCSATAQLISPMPVVSGLTPAYTELAGSSQPVVIVSQVLAWTHHAIPPRAPPLA